MPLPPAITALPSFLTFVEGVPIFFPASKITMSEACAISASNIAHKVIAVNLNFICIFGYSME